MAVQHELISIIVPVYNIEPYLRRCVDSIIAQTYVHLEIILVDDGSPDACGEICDAYASADNRVKVIHKSNGGLSDARNVGLDIATGVYIGFVDADDYIHPMMYEIMYREMIENNADIVSCQRRKVFEMDVVSESQQIINEYSVKTFSNEDAIWDLLVEGKWLFAAAWEKLYRRDCFEKIRFPFGELYEDQAVMYKVFWNVKKIISIEAVLYYWYMRENSIMHQKYSAKITEDILKHPLEAVLFFEEAGFQRGMMAARINYARNAIIQWKMAEDEGERIMARKIEDTYKKVYDRLDDYQTVFGKSGWMLRRVPKIYNFLRKSKKLLIHL